MEHIVNLKDATILLVDDDEIVRRLTSKALENICSSCLQADSVSSAKKIINDNLPQLIILDLGMPGESGFDFLKYRKEHKEIKHIPVIVFSGHNKEKVVLKALRNGADDFMVKPLNTYIMLKKIRKIFYDLTKRDVSYQPNGDEMATVKFSSDVVKINEFKAIIQSPLRINVEGLMIEVNSAFFQQNAERDCICIVTSHSRRIENADQYFTPIRFKGMPEDDQERLSNKIKDWR